MSNRSTADIAASYSGTRDLALPSPASRAPAWLGAAFLASGFAAPIDQVIWQRVLFTVFGINIEAVTVVLISSPDRVGSARE